MKTIGVLTADFSAYYDIVQALRARGVSFESLVTGEPIPLHVGVVITTAGEAAHLDHPNVLAFSTADDTVTNAVRLLRNPGPFLVCIIGVDPGERPGIAVLADGRVLDLVHARGPEAVQDTVRNVLATVPADRFVIRVGNGAPTFRDRILQTLAGLDAELELVDERRSTPADYHGPAERDTGAATNIALMPGTPLHAGDLRPARPSEGELRDIQRKSRVVSNGQVTISRSLARYVALGRLSLDEAVDRTRQGA